MSCPVPYAGGVEQRRKPQLTFCECEVLATLTYTYPGSLFPDPGDVRSLTVGVIWNFIKGKGLPWLGNQFKAHKEPVKKA